MSKLVFSPPNRETPGFLRRARQAAEFQDSLSGQNIKPETLDQLVKFLLDFVDEPTDKAEAEGLLWDASQAQFEDMLAAISGADSDPLA